MASKVSPILILNRFNNILTDYWQKKNNESISKLQTHSSSLALQYFVLTVQKQFFLLCLMFRYCGLSCVIPFTTVTINYLALSLPQTIIITKTRLFKYKENFTSKNWKFSDRKLWYFLHVCWKHRLRVLVRTVSARRFLRVPTIYDFEQK